MQTQSPQQAARLEQRAHDARINVELAEQALTKLERQLDEQRRTKLAELATLDEQLEHARQAKAALEAESERCIRECETHVPNFKRPEQQ